MAAPTPGIDGLETRGELKRFVEEQILGDLRQRVQRILGRDRSGDGSPEGLVEAPLGTRYTNRLGGAGTTLYVKEGGGSGNTGWAGK